MKISLGTPTPPRRFKFRVPRKFLKITAIAAGSLAGLLAIALIIVFAKRDALLRAAVERAVSKAKTDYHLALGVQNARFEGIKTVAIDHISVVPENRDSLVNLDGLRVSVRLFPLLFGKIKLAELSLSSGRITPVKKDSITNYDFLFRKKKQDTTATKPSLAKLADNLLNNLLNKVPDDMNIRNLDFLFTSDSTKLRFFTSEAIIRNGNLQSSIAVNNGESTWHIDGKMEPDEKQFDLRLYADGKKVELPMLYDKYQLRLNFDDAAIRLISVDRDGDELKIASNWQIHNLLINHPKLAASDITVPDGSIDANMLVGENFIALDSSSVIHLKKITANPYLKYTLFPVKLYELGLHTDELPAQDLFDSFPGGMFEALEGMRVSGKLKYALDFKLDASLPDSLTFHSSLSSSDFRIIRQGNTNLQKINASFVYTPYEFGKPMRDIVIGPENPSFMPLETISQNLRSAVLTAEDPTFFSHHGFVEQAIRRSIATDFKTKTFKQGGSTISMQLVKNVYLNRQKTLARKIEEMMIVWLIENNHLSNKQRMLETYLNLIEWGPNVYGIGEASRYYFDKEPYDLNIGESIFLASIVPRPKKALYFFEPDGSLRPSLGGYFRLIGGLMARRGLAASDSTGTYGFYDVRLKPSLRTLISPDSTVNDSTLMAPDGDEDGDNFLQNILNRKDPQRKIDTISIHDLDKLVAPPARDTVKSRSDIRKEKRDAKKIQKAAEDAEKKRLKELKKAGGG